MSPRDLPQVQRAFAEAPLLWGGRHKGFVPSGGAVCGGAAVAEALGLVEPLAALPGLASFCLSLSADLSLAPWTSR